MSSEYTRFLVVGHCCRDWPMTPPALAHWGRCGLCGQVPKQTDKTIEQYMQERNQGEEK